MSRILTAIGPCITGDIYNAIYLTVCTDIIIDKKQVWTQMSVDSMFWMFDSVLC